jgi:hypothetical protein
LYGFNSENIPARGKVGISSPVLITHIIPTPVEIFKFVRILYLLRIEKVEGRKINAET